MEGQSFFPDRKTAAPAQESGATARHAPVPNPAVPRATASPVPVRPAAPTADQRQPQPRVRKRTETSYRKMVEREEKRREAAREKERERKKKERERRRKYVDGAKRKLGSMVFDFYAKRGIDDPGIILSHVTSDLARAGGGE